MQPIIIVKLRKLIKFESELSSEIRDAEYVRELTGRIDFLIKSYTRKSNNA